MPFSKLYNFLHIYIFSFPPPLNYTDGPSGLLADAVSADSAYRGGRLCGLRVCRLQQTGGRLLRAEMQLQNRRAGDTVGGADRDTGNAHRPVFADATKRAAPRRRDHRWRRRQQYAAAGDGRGQTVFLRRTLLPVGRPLG